MVGLPTMAVEEGVVAGVEDKRAEVEGVGVTVEGCEGIIVCVCCGVVEFC